MTARRHLFHIGLPKAGSSFLQTGIFPALASEGIIAVKHEYRQQLRDVMCHLSTEQKIFATGDDDRKIPLITSEEWVLGLKPQEWSLRIKRFISICPPNSEIILVIRDPVEWTRSAASQLLNEGWVKNIEAACSSEDGIKASDINYETIIEAIRAAGVPLHIVHLTALTDRDVWESILDVIIPEEMWKRAIQSGRRYRSLSALGVRLYQARDRLLERFGLMVLGSEQAFQHFGAASQQAINSITPLEDLTNAERFRLLPGRVIRELLYRVGSSSLLHKISGSPILESSTCAPLSPTEKSLQQQKYLFIPGTT